ncbi:hypothetical protein [Mesorhizobium caraganae]|uniref:hypothetical protein n=1 Tax=Mesorhizobium caraganae TaxID=483206 RepID=UPI003ECFCC39
MRIALLAKIWIARLALFGRFKTAGILMGFDASDRDVVSLHMLRTMRPRANIVVLNLGEATATPEIEAFTADLRIRWSLKMFGAGFRPGSRPEDEVIGADPDTFRMLVRAARDAGCDAIAYGRRKIARPFLYNREKAAQEAASWIDPASYFTDKNIRSYVEHYRLPVCRSAQTIAALPPIPPHPKLLERMRGLGYF